MARMHSVEANQDVRSSEKVYNLFSVSLELSFELIAPKGSHCFVAESAVKLQSSRKQNVNHWRLEKDLDCHNLQFYHEAWLMTHGVQAVRYG